VGHVILPGRLNTHRGRLRYQKGREHLENVDVDGKSILKYVLKWVGVCGLD
jgi:hypothetical protein